MDDLNSLMEDLGIEALEANTKIASVAVILSTGQVAYQSPNWDLSNQTTALLEVLNGEASFYLNNIEFSAIAPNTGGIIGKNPNNMGSIILAPFHDGVLVGYVMPFTDPQKALDFLLEFAPRLNGKV